MYKHSVLIGVGEMGGVFARGLLRLGHAIYPVTRHVPLADACREVGDPELVLVAVGEQDLSAVLQQMPAPWRERLCLLQNELLPSDWEGIADPTVISVWFEKKPGREAKEIIPSPVYGPQAELIGQALGTLDLNTRRLASADELLFELVLKNVYILTSNIAGLCFDGSVGELWERHPQYTRDLAMEVIDIQQALTGRTFDREALLQAMLTAFRGDPEHHCLGRSAPARLRRAIAHTDRFGLEAPLMRKLQARLSIA